MNAVILVNKDKGKTSRDIVNNLTKVFNTKRIGHTGTLDPIAQGVLVICINKYTKLVNSLMSLDKQYIGTITLGVKTDTFDITGKVLEQKDVSVSKENIEKVFSSLIGKYEQVVPIYSAKKVNGKKLYEYARNGEEVKLPINEVDIYNLELISYEDNKIVFKCNCSKGTYIRSLIQTICEKLNVIGTMSDLIRTKQGNFDISNTYTIKDIENGNYKMLSVKDLFDYTRYDKNKVKIKKEILDLNLFVPQLVDEFYPSFMDHKLECRTDFYEGALNIEGNGELLARAIGNLISNAIKYGVDGKLVEVHTGLKDKMAFVAIVNYGKIIPAEDLDKIFDKFYRVENSRSLKTGGTGLGLAIAKNIVNLHEGEIWATSDESGTRFQIELPVVQAHAPKAGK